MTDTERRYIEGPGWAPRLLDVNAGRFPLAVEGHLLQMTSLLVPGVTTVTTNARYYSLHAYVALLAAERRLEWTDTQRLLRRCEVVMAAATLLDDQTDGGWAGAHGLDRIEPHVAAGVIDLAELAEPGGYAKSRSGFLPVYIGSELELQILASTTMEIGPRVDEGALRDSFGEIETLAEQDSILVSELTARPNLSARATEWTDDGRWLARLFCADGLNEVRQTDVTRRNTVTLLARSLDLQGDLPPDHAFRLCVAYGPLARTDPVLSAIPEAAPWRGTLLRHHSVNAWRRLWAWLVDRIGGDFADPNGHTDPAVLAEAAVAACPSGTVASFIESLPAEVDTHGDPLDAESIIAASGWNDFHASLAVLAVGGRRVDGLHDDVLKAFLGRRPTVLDPRWVRHQFDQSMSRSMSDFVAELVDEVLARSQRVASRKARVQRDGTYRIPSRVHEHAGKLWKTSNEGRGAVGLRINELARNLAAVGVLEHRGTQWRVTETGRQLLADE